MHDFITSINNQTTAEAKKWFGEKRKIGLFTALRKTCDRFLKAYLIKQGFRDGFYGYMAARFAGLYQFFSYVKYWEMRKRAK